MQDSDWYNDPTTLLGELRRSRPLITPPVTIAGYDDIRLLRRGGQGAVYSALQQSTRRRVAIKVLYEDADSSEMRRRRFEREVDLVAQLQHPNIVRIYDSGVMADGRLYFVMEYIEGDSLNEYIQQHPCMPTTEKLLLFREICAAVHFAHQHGVIHRDLKPSNIRIDTAGVPHILDFGIAKLESGWAGEAVVTFTGQFLGTLAYASPEQVQGVMIDVRSDVYALGVNLYESLSGTLPYEATGTLADSIRAITEQQPAPPSLIALRRGGSRAALNAELDTLVLTALAKDPDRRYQSAEDLRADVEHYLGGEPIDAKRDSTWYVVRKTVLRHKFPFAAAALFVVLLVGFGVAMSVLYQRSRLEAAKARQIQIFLEDTLASVQPAVPGQDVTVREVLDETVHWVEFALGGQPEIGASLRNTIGNSYRSLGLYEKSRQQLQKACDIRRQHFGSRSLQVAASMNSLALLYRDEGQDARAEELFRDALEIEEAHFGNRDPRITNNLMNLASVLVRKGDYERARELYIQALGIRRELLGEQHPDVAMCHYRLGQLNLSEGRLRQALQRHIRALDIRKHALHPNHPDVARSHLAVGRLHLLDHAPQVAEPELRAALEIRQQVLSAGHWEIAQVQSELGDCLRQLERYEQAEELLLQSYRTFAAESGRLPDRLSAVVEKCVRLYEAWGRPQQASHYKQMLPRS